MMKNTKYIMANWKMNPDTGEEAKSILTEIKKRLKAIKNAKIVICPPFVFTNLAKNILEKSGLDLGVQDVYIGQGNAHTGEVGIEMIKSLNAKYIMVGHSEKKAAGETEETISIKVAGVIKNNLKVILCIGEKERNECGDYFQEIEKQIISALSKIQKKFAGNIIIAYEPIWAIGKSEKEAINSEKLQEMVIFIRKILSNIVGHEKAENIPILYGGSVNKNNAEDLIKEGRVNGVLVGRESLDPKNFVDMVKSILN